MPTRGRARIPELYDRHIPEWRHDNLYLRYAIGIAASEIREAHASAKQTLHRNLRCEPGVASNWTKR